MAPTQCWVISCRVKSVTDITPLCIHSSLMNCFNNVIFLRFYNELKFHILSRDGKTLGLSPGIKISILSKSGHSTFVLWTVDIRNERCCDMWLSDRRPDDILVWNIYGLLLQHSSLRRSSVSALTRYLAFWSFLWVLKNYRKKTKKKNLRKELHSCQQKWL